MAIRGELFGTAVAAGYEIPGDGSERAAARKEMLQKNHAQTNAGAEQLELCHMAQIFVRNFMGEHASQLVVGGFLEKTPGNIKNAASGVGGVDFRCVDVSRTPI